MQLAAGTLNPFDPDNEAGYARWRDRKLENYPVSSADLVVEVADPRRLTAAEHAAIVTRCRKTNMAIYATRSGRDPDRELPGALGRQFGLTELDCNRGADKDGVTALQVVQGEWRSDYIPYTSRPMHWHTDGYYNTPSRQVRALLLHCVSPAARGGANALLDHEIAYIYLRECNPDFIRALMAPDVMTIPAHCRDGREIRPARDGPVFSIQPDGSLHMRYTARTRSIEWPADSLTRAALHTLEDLLASASPYIFRTTLQAGQGLISNNILHDRTGFDEDAAHPRRLYRLRYYQRMSGTWPA
jgi:hypothetical protein